jgi:hypothetical protein
LIVTNFGITELYIEARFEINRGYITVLGLHTAEGRRNEEEAEIFINNYKK